MQPSKHFITNDNPVQHLVQKAWLDMYSPTNHFPFSLPWIQIEFSASEIRTKVLDESSFLFWFLSHFISASLKQTLEDSIHSVILSHLSSHTQYIQQVISSPVSVYFSLSHIFQYFHQLLNYFLFLNSVEEVKFPQELLRHCGAFLLLFILWVCFILYAYVLQDKFQGILRGNEHFSGIREDNTITKRVQVLLKTSAFCFSLIGRLASPSKRLLL